MKLSIFLVISLLSSQAFDHSKAQSDFYEPFSCPHMTPSRFRCNSSFKFASFDGSCNNLARPWTGMMGSVYKRYFPSDYSDNLSSPRLFTISQRLLPNPRTISRALADDNSLLNPLFTHLLPIFGQFLAHDMSNQALTTDPAGNFIDCSCQSTNPACLSIRVPSSENLIKLTCMKFTRSNSANDFLKCNTTKREQFNLITSFLEASQVYGGSSEASLGLRAMHQGKMKTSNGFMTIGRPYMPMNPNMQFVGGEARVNENMALASLHTLFLREHNRISLILASLNPNWNDDRLFLESRRIVQAEYQHIIFAEYLPAILGRHLAADLRPGPSGLFFNGYDPSFNATMSNEFAAAAYRFGHSLVRNRLGRFDASARESHLPVNLSEIIFNTGQAFVNGGLDFILNGLVNQAAARYDASLADTLQNHLFEVPLADGTIQAIDLAAANVQRGRDHGLPSYVFMRQKCGSKPILAFDDLSDTVDEATISRLAGVYEHVTDVDFYIGGLAERPLSGAAVGPTFACIIRRQFMDLKKGDRFYYENSPRHSAGAFSLAQLDEIRKVSLASLICSNFDLDVVQADVFVIPNSLNNQRMACLDGRLRTPDLNMWKSQ